MVRKSTASCAAAMRGASGQWDIGGDYERCRPDAPLICVRVAGTASAPLRPSWTRDLPPSFAHAVDRLWSDCPRREREEQMRQPDTRHRCLAHVECVEAGDGRS